MKMACCFVRPIKMGVIYNEDDYIVIFMCSALQVIIFDAAGSICFPPLHILLFFLTLEVGKMK